MSCMYSVAYRERIYMTCLHWCDNLEFAIEACDIDGLKETLWDAHDIIRAFTEGATRDFIGMDHIQQLMKTYVLATDVYNELIK